MKLCITKVVIALLLLGSVYNIVYALPFTYQIVCRDIKFQSDGKILMCGTTGIETLGNLLVARYNGSDGALDTTFGTEGVVTSVIGKQSSGRSVAVQSDAKIVVAGNTIDTDGLQKMYMTRYLSGGTVDATYGTSGVTKILVGNSTMIFDIAIQSDDKAVAVGYSNVNNRSVVTIMRFNVDGSLDTSFGGTGIVTTQIGFGARASSLAIQPDGKIVVVGSGSASSLETQAGLVRYNSDGSLDMEFGNQGVALTVLGSVSELVTVVLQPDGKIVAAGYQNSNAVIIRLNADGTFDSEFGSAGVVTDFYGTSSQIYALALQADGKVVAAGISRLGRLNQFVLARYTTVGAKDVTFGYSGVVPATPIEGLFVSDMHIQPDGKYVVLGYNSGGTKLGRFIDPGFPDIAFGEFGIVVQPKNYLPSISVTYVWDQKSSGTHGGSYTTGAWQARDLNSLKGDLMSVSVASNQITLQPGTYCLHAISPAYNIGNHQIRLQNITDGRTEKYGSSVVAAGASNVNNCSELYHQFFIAQAKTFEIQHAGSASQATNGLGVASAFAGNNEIYTQVDIIRLDS